MINIDYTGRACLVAGPATTLLVSMVLSVRLGTQHAEEYLPQGTPMATGDPVPDGYRAYTMLPGMTYNILREADKFSRTFTNRVVATVLVDRDGQSWVGRPSAWRPMEDQFPTAWARLLSD